MPKKRLSFWVQSYTFLNAFPDISATKFYEFSGYRTSDSLIDRLDDIQDKLDYQRTHPEETVDFQNYEIPLANAEFKPFETAKETETVPFRLTR